jgi:hypothetical protein
MTRGTCRALVVVAIALWTGAAGAQPRGDVSVTVHNLSVSGPGKLKSLTETEVCRFCHVPHRPILPEPLWNQPLSQAQYQTPMVPSSGGTSSPAPQPDGASRLCLSCHDGTVAIGVPGPASSPGASLRLTPASRGWVGTDLSGSHPVSFVVVDRMQETASESDMRVRPLASILLDRHVRLDASGKMQCTSCHDPHDDSHYVRGMTPHFLVKPTTAEVCLTCHELD